MACIAYQPEAWAAEPARTALVIGNGGYAEAPLKNPVNDARDMRDVFQTLGFEVIYREDVGREEMFAAVREFGQRLAERKGVGAVFYAGHGIQVGGNNYLIPLRSGIQSEDEVPYQSLPLDQILAKLDSAGNKLNLVFLDACRNNPFARSFRSANRGLARTSAPTGTKIFYATKPNEEAKDGDGRNGVFTRHLLTALGQPGLELSGVFQQTAKGVMEETAERQTPWEEGIVLGQFFFRPAPGTQPSPPPQPLEPPRAPPPAPPTVGWLQVTSDRAAEVLIGERRLGRVGPGEVLNLDRVPLPAGTVQVQAVAGTERKSQQVSIPAGGWGTVAFRFSDAAGNAMTPSHNERPRPASTLGGKRIGPQDRYFDHEDGTVTDVVTGLMWMRCAIGQSWTGKTCKGKSRELAWENAQTYTIKFAGYDDWRLPTIGELGTIVYCSNGNPEYYTNGKNASDENDDWGCYGRPVKDHIRPTLAPGVFPNSPASLFWSSSRDVFLPCPNGIYFGYGSVSNTNGTGFTHVRMVRRSNG